MWEIIWTMRGNENFPQFWQGVNNMNLVSNWKFCKRDIFKEIIYIGSIDHEVIAKLFNQGDSFKQVKYLFPLIVNLCAQIRMLKYAAEKLLDKTDLLKKKWEQIWTQWNIWTKMNDDKFLLKWTKK